MSDESRGYNDAFDGALEEILPDDIDDAAVEKAAADDDSTYEHGGWFTKNYTHILQVEDDVRDDVAAGEVSKAAATLDLPESTIGLANNTFAQYADRTESSYIVELYAAAALYCAAKLSGEGVSPTEIVENGPGLLDEKKLLRRSKEIASTLGLDPTAFMDATQYVDRYCEELELGEDVRTRAREILRVCDEAGLSSGKSPTGWAAAAVYLSSLELGAGTRQRELANVADVTEVTIRNRYQEQQEFIHADKTAPDGCRASINWIAQRVDIDDAVVATAAKVWDRLEESSFELQNPEQTRLIEAVNSEPALWAGSMLLFASRVQDVDLGTRRLTSILETTGAELNRRARVLKRALWDADTNPNANPKYW